MTPRCGSVVPGRGRVTAWVTAGSQQGPSFLPAASPRTLGLLSLFASPMADLGRDGAPWARFWPFLPAGRGRTANRRGRCLATSSLCSFARQSENRRRHARSKQIESGVVVQCTRLAPRDGRKKRPRTMARPRSSLLLTQLTLVWSLSGRPGGCRPATRGSRERSRPTRRCRGSAGRLVCRCFADRQTSLPEPSRYSVPRVRPGTFPC